MTLTLSSVGKTYPSRHGAAVQAVKSMDLAVGQGEIVALLGSSGCGKTSTLRMIAGFESVTEGSISLAGRRIDQLPPARRGVAMAFEGYALYPPLNVEQNIGFGLDPHRTNVAQCVREIADLVEIGSILAQRPAALSGGQQQRASLARALARDADLHLLDEPMSQLEPQLRSVLRGRIKALIKQRHLTVLLVTHDQTEASAMADRIAVMEAGVLQQYGFGDTLWDRPDNLFVATFLGEPPMNALPARVESRGIRLRDAAAMFLPMPDTPLPAPGTDVVLGIRPQRIALGVGTWRGTVASNQWLGDQAHVALDVAGNTVVAVAYTRVPARVGSELSFSFPVAWAHLFDAVTGHALLHGTAPA